MLSKGNSAVSARPVIQGGFGHHEETRLYRDRRSRRRGGCHDHRRARHRAERAGDQVAPDLELPEEPRHDLRRGRDVRQIRRARRPTTSSRSRSSPPARSSRACRRPTRCSNGTVEMCHTATYYYCRQGPDLRLRHRHSVRPQLPHAERLDVSRRRHGPDERVLRGLQLIGFPCGNTGAQMGGWFRKEIKIVADLNGLKMRIGGFAGKVHRPSSAWCRSRSPAATSIRRWKRARSTRPNGSAPMTTRSSASTRSRRTTTIRAGGKAARCSHIMVNTGKWEELPKTYQAIVKSACAGRQCRHDGEVRRDQPGGAEASWWPAARSCGRIRRM